MLTTIKAVLCPHNAKDLNDLVSVEINVLEDSGYDGKDQFNETQFKGLKIFDNKKLQKHPYTGINNFLVEYNEEIYEFKPKSHDNRIMESPDGYVCEFICCGVSDYNDDCFKTDDSFEFGNNIQKKKIMMPYNPFENIKESELSQNKLVSLIDSNVVYGDVLYIQFAHLSNYNLIYGGGDEEEMDYLVDMSKDEMILVFESNKVIVNKNKKDFDRLLGARNEITINKLNNYYERLKKKNFVIWYNNVYLRTYLGDKYNDSMKLTEGDMKFIENDNFDTWIRGQDQKIKEKHKKLKNKRKPNAMWYYIKKLAVFLFLVYLISSIIVMFLF